MQTQTVGEWKSQGQWTAHRGLKGWKEQQRKKQRGGRRRRQVRANGVRRGVRESTWASDVDRGIKESAKGPQWTHILSVCVCFHCTSYSLYIGSEGQLLWAVYSTVYKLHKRCITSISCTAALPLAESRIGFSFKMLYQTKKKRVQTPLCCYLVESGCLLSFLY